MRLTRLATRGFRNLVDLDLRVPPPGLVVLGANGQGKTSLLEAIAYPVLFRSFRTSMDAELVRFGEAGFRVALEFEREGRPRSVLAEFRVAGRRRKQELDGAAAERLVDAAGAWLAVVFAPDDVRLAAGPSSGRRLFLDRTLALSDPVYLRALARYRAALAQRNAALRQGRPDLASAFDAPLAAAGAVIVARRAQWVETVGPELTTSLIALGEHSAEADLQYRGTPELADPAAWPERLAQAAGTDAARRMTTVGPHRDDLELLLGGRPLRAYGSTGQHRSAAIALKLLELDTIGRAAGAAPALLLDDVFAELDGERQERLAARLLGAAAAQVFISAPRADELPRRLELPVWRVAQGRIEAGSA
ncbi:MAG TPA: DNA replication and repair protein RecF [Gemmatimonadales bacterium]|nr:DNA replication and repair protein RecF [Gemmatimonadales bacterium]